MTVPVAKNTFLFDRIVFPSKLLTQLTFTIENADKKTASLFKQMAEALKLSFHIQKKEEIKYNPEFVRRVEDLRSGKVKPIKFDEEALKELLK